MIPRGWPRQKCNARQKGDARGARGEGALVAKYAEKLGFWGKGGLALGMQ